MDIESITNKIINADCMEFMQQLPKGQITLIYIDPPYCCEMDKKFGMIAWDKNIQEKNRVDEIFPLIEQIEGKGLANYLRWIYPRLRLMKDLLADDGSIYVHCDWRVNSSLRLILDEIFGKENYVNEIAWCYKSGGVSNSTFARKHDNIIFYRKNFNNATFNIIKEKSYNRGLKPYRFKGVEEFKDEIGWYTLVNCKDTWQIDMVGRSSDERNDYPTQKPEALLERIIKASSNENDIVADFFCGSGTTLAVAEKLGRKWIGCDCNKEAVDIACKRLEKIQAQLKLF